MISKQCLQICTYVMGPNLQILNEIFFFFERQNGHLYVWYYLHFVQRKNALQRYAFLKIVISLELNISKDCFLNGPTAKVLSI